MTAVNGSSDKDPDCNPLATKVRNKGWTSLCKRSKTLAEDWTIASELMGQIVKMDNEDNLLQLVVRF